MRNKIMNIFVILGITAFGLTIGVTAANTISANSVTYNDSTVQETLDELIDIAVQCPDNALCSKASIGDYVSMTPTQTTYKILGKMTGYKDTTTGEYIDQTINPSELNLWRIININNDGTVDLVSEYVSNSNVCFYGREGYLNYVGTLNTIANQYSNSKYVKKTRHMGYNGQTSTITDISKFTYPAPWTTGTTDNSNEAVGGGDILHERDKNLVTTALGTLDANNLSGTVTKYWLASRFYGYNSSNEHSNWRGRYVDTGGTIRSLYYYQNGWNEYYDCMAVRPIVTLKADITLYTGSGTSDSPWVLS